MATIKLSQPEDIDDIRKISEAVFRDYGQYGEILPRFFEVQGVTTFVARIQSKVVGFIMMGFLPWSGGDADSEHWFADLLAIAVAPGRQGQGIGGELMEQALELVGQMSEWRDVREIQLTCAKSNQAGLRFFSRYGYRVSNPNHGSYSGGQPAMRLARNFP